VGLKGTRDCGDNQLEQGEEYRDVVPRHEVPTNMGLPLYHFECKIQIGSNNSLDLN
jgi:hypothetical protein